MIVQATSMPFGSFSVMPFTGVPTSTGIGIASVITTVMNGMDGNIFVLTAAQRHFSGCDFFSLPTLSFFSLGGNIMNKGGIVKRLVRFARLLVGWVSGYLAVTNALANISFGAVSGSPVAAISAMGSIIGPLKLDEGYDPNYLAATNICSAPTGILIPPSGPLILYFITAGGVSVAALFMSGYLTGVLLGVVVVGLVIFLVVRKGYRASVVREEDPARKIVLEAVPSLSVVIIVMGGILTGIFMVTEAGMVMCPYYTLLVIICHKMSIETFYDLLADTMKSSATILFLIAASLIMSYVMSYFDILAATSEGLMSISNSRYMIILTMNVFLLVMGMFLDLTPTVLIFTPISLPIATSVGISPVHFGSMLIMNLGIGSVTPPVGSRLFASCSVGRVKTKGVIKHIIPIFAAMVISLFLVSFISAVPPLVPYLCGLVSSMWW